MRSRRRRILAARVLAIVFLAAGGFKLWQASTQGDLLSIADVVLYFGLAVLYYAIAREENRK